MSDSSPKQEPPYGLRMPPDLKARVKAAAEANNRSMNAEIVARLEASFEYSPELEWEMASRIIDKTLEYLEREGWTPPVKNALARDD